MGDGLRRVGIKADQLTVAGLVISVASGVAIGGGYLGLGAFLLALSAVPDVLDGAVAKASGTASPRGAFFDSVIDRLSDGVVLGGFAWYLASTEGAHMPLLPMAVLGASGLVSYERARAESLGFTARGGLMERAERMIALGLGLVFSAVMVPILWLMLALTMFTAVQRFVMVWQQAGRPPVPAGTPSTPSASTRLRAWRPRATWGSDPDDSSARRAWRNALGRSVRNGDEPSAWHERPRRPNRTRP